MSFADMFIELFTHTYMFIHVSIVVLLIYDIYIYIYNLIVCGFLLVEPNLEPRSFMF